MIVTIDGTAGSGKSTTAKLVAKRLGYKYIDTGATYRAVALSVKQNKIEPTNRKKVTALSSELDISFRDEKIFLNDEDVTQAIRTEEIGKLASLCSKYKGVRENMVKLQRRMASGPALMHKCGIVCEGRDIGTVVFPEAEVKIYMDADHHIRTARRLKELREKRVSAKFEEISRDLKSRDIQDKLRQLSPLKVPLGAVIINTTNLSIEEQVEKVIKKISTIKNQISK
ncbi:(d)CMP kinase [candidate division WOR-3 bacterium]|nr:(d)CMP kinase [candidate division WOR-3 bacterium]